MTATVRTVVFVCQHGALRSRLAAAFFNRLAPAGWRGTSAGLQPQEAISRYVIPLAESGGVVEHLDRAPPGPLSAVQEPDLVVAVDCQVPGAVPWRLYHQEVDEGLAAELQERAERLAGELTDAGL